MAARVTGRSWEDLMRRQLFGPLGMDEAGFGAPGRAGPLDQPRGHSAAGLSVEPGARGDNPSALAPAGGVHASLAGWARFLALHLNRGRGTEGYLRPESFEKLQTPAVTGEPHALGWLVLERDWGGGRVLTHSGSNTMWYAMMWFAPLRDFGVLVVTNQGGDLAARASGAATRALIQHHRE